MGTVAVCPGSFDPVTTGHLDVIERASHVYEQIIAAVAASPRKAPVLSLEDRLDLIRQSTAHLTNVAVDSFDGLLVEFCRRHKATVIVKGLRAISDFEYELGMAQMNRRLAPEIETNFLMTSPEFAFLSSSLVKEVAEHGGPIAGLVPKVVEQRLLALWKRSEHPGEAFGGLHPTD